MPENIDRIYELTNSPILTPANLLKNIKLENYTEIKYYKTNGELVCEMISIEEENLIKYLYQFDLSDNLKIATILLNDEKMEIFNRKSELKTVV